MERPSLAVLLERKVKELAAHDGFTQNVECGSRLAVGVVAKLVYTLGIGHDGRNVALITFHVIGNVACRATTRGVVAVPLLLGEVLAEGVEAFVHPGPLALIGIDDHRKEVVAYLVDDHRDHAVFGALGVGAIGFRTTAVEADHRVLHPDPLAVYRNGYRIWIVDGVGAVAAQGVRYGLGAVLLPQRIALLGVVAHGQWSLVTYLYAHGVPDELARRSERKVTYVFGLKDPGLLAFLLALFGFAGFFFGDDHHRAVGVLGRGKAFALGGGQHLAGVGQLTSGAHNVVRRHGDGHLVIAEIEGELTATEELLVLPAIVVTVHSHAWVELCNGVQVVAVLLKILVA